MTKNATQNTKKSLQKYKNLPSEPAREAQRHPGCCFELRRAKRAGAQTRLRPPGACIRPPGNKKMPAPEHGAWKFKKMPVAPNSELQISQFQNWKCSRIVHTSHGNDRNWVSDKLPNSRFVCQDPSGHPESIF